MPNDTFRASRKAERRRLRPMAEGLESRLLLYSTLGAQWTHGSRITFSFAPDGTNVGGVSSSWFQSMANRGISTASWQEQFQKAAAVWEAVADINLVLVPDDGSPFSVSGNQQGDPRFGDIRIAGTPQGYGTVAMAFSPPPINGGTLAGDIVMNSSLAWKVNNDYDIMTVAIHEFGHALGMDHSAVSQAVMYSAYSSKKQTLTSDDTLGIQSIYGTRQPDAFEPNNTAGIARTITSYVNAQGQVSLSGLDISSATDLDWFYVVAPASTTGSLTVRMQSTNLSELSPRINVYNAGLQALAQDSRPLTYGDTATVTINGVAPGQGFYIRASAANTGATGSGAYGLQLNFGNRQQAPVPPPNTVVAEQPQGGGGSNPILLDGPHGYVWGRMNIQVGNSINADARGKVGSVASLEAAARLGVPDLKTWLAQDHLIQIGLSFGFGDVLTVGEAGLHAHPGDGLGNMIEHAASHAFDGWYPFLAGADISEPDSPLARTARKAQRIVDAALQLLGGD
jgi:hypothetical protein